MVCYTGNELNEKLKGVAVEVVYQGTSQVNSNSSVSILPILIILGAIFLLGAKK
jgi:hypothetical protein